MYATRGSAIPRVSTKMTLCMNFTAASRTPALVFGAHTSSSMRFFACVRTSHGWRALRLRQLTRGRYLKRCGDDEVYAQRAEEQWIDARKRLHNDLDCEWVSVLKETCECVQRLRGHYGISSYSQRNEMKDGRKTHIERAPRPKAQARISQNGAGRAPSV